MCGFDNFWLSAVVVFAPNYFRVLQPQPRAPSVLLRPFVEADQVEARWTTWLQTKSDTPGQGDRRGALR